MYRVEEGFSNCLSSHICLIKIIIRLSYFHTPFICLFSDIEIPEAGWLGWLALVTATACLPRQQQRQHVQLYMYTRWYCKCVNGIHTIQYICMVWYGMVWYRMMYVSKCLPRQEETTQLTTQPTICIQARSPWKPKIQTPNLSKFIYKPKGNSLHLHI